MNGLTKYFAAVDVSPRIIILPEDQRRLTSSATLLS